jgi:UDP-glucuronate 4-epimerase
MSKYLITGTAGFIGFHLTEALLSQGHEVIWIDNLNSYYDVNLKNARLKESGIDCENVEWYRAVTSKKWPDYRFIRMNLEDKKELTGLFKNEKFDLVINLAAQAGVRYSLENPDAYISSNINGFFNILEACRSYPPGFLLYASSSSVYGNNRKLPFSEDDNVDNPVSLYAATKKSNELLAAAYTHLYNIPSTGLRFFTVYGPWGRPDMAVFRFTEAISQGKQLQVYGDGTMRRDFTYIDDIINGLTGIIGSRQTGNNPPALLNIGNNNPVTVMDLITEIENSLGKKAVIEYLPVQPGDVNATYADITRIRKYCGFRPSTDIRSGIRKFCDWYEGYFKTKGLRD